MTSVGVAVLAAPDDSERNRRPVEYGRKRRESQPTTDPRTFKRQTLMDGRRKTLQEGTQETDTRGWTTTLQEGTSETLLGQFLDKS